MKQYTELDEILLGNRSKLISKLYKYGLKEFTLEEAGKTQMVRWAENINRPIMLEEWELLWNKIWKMSECTRLRENNIKMFYYWYMTPEIISKMSNGIFSDKCWKYHKERGTFYHIWWTCLMAKKIWDMIFTVDQNI